jgi:hypothetical protein
MLRTSSLRDVVQAMEAVPVAQNVSDLYQYIIIETPLAPYFKVNGPAAMFLPSVFVSFLLCVLSCSSFGLFLGFPVLMGGARNR